MNTVRFGIIGCGLMGRELATATARWAHLPEMDVRPELIAVCDTNAELLEWYTGNFPSITQSTADYKELLGNDAIDAIYCAVPHHLHQQFYCDIIDADKALLGEKPFGIDKSANDAINAALAEHPDVFVRCSSEFPFFPAVQAIGKLIDDNAFGQVIEYSAAFLHSSDLNPDKPINWKRMIECNGEYGCMGDLGMHVCHVPFRAGFAPTNVRAVLSNIMPTRPDGKGNVVPCETWDNATLLCEASNPAGETFPMTLKTQRIAPGETNTWQLEIKGTKGCARFSTKNPRRLEILEYTGGRQAWQQIDTGQETAYKSITGGIFEFGFSDAMLQMWAAFLHEMTTGEVPCRFAGCVRPDEAALSHKLFTAALESQKSASTVALD